MHPSFAGRRARALSPDTTLFSPPSRDLAEKIKCPRSSRVAWTHWVLAYLVVTLPAFAAVSQQQKITSDPRGVGAQFGNAVAISGNTMVVGAQFDATTASQAGAAFVFVRNGSTWAQQAKLLASDGAAVDKFGCSVAISADTVVVGAFNDDAPDSNAGSAYVFVRTGTTWTQQQKLTGAGIADQEFGHAVAILGETIAVGEHFADLPQSSAEAGAVYIFRRSGTVWTGGEKLVPFGGVILGDQFGAALAMSGDKLIVGAPGADIPETRAGSVYVFALSGGVYAQQDKLSIPSGANGDNFGYSVAIDGNTLIGGALFHEAVPAQTNSGAAYVYELAGGTWTSQGRLLAADSALGDNFGWSVAVSGDMVVVGSRGDDTAAGGDAGSAYFFTRSGTTWTQEQKIEPDDPFNGDRFGASVALSLGDIVIGASEKALTSPNGQGAVYTFRVQIPHVFPNFDSDVKADISIFRPGGQWWYQRSTDNTVGAQQFGAAGDLMAPADYDGDGRTDPGVFRPASGDWFRLHSADGHFDTVALGARGDWPVPADYDGDGLADVAVFRPSTGEWLRINSSNSQPVTATFGESGDIPLIADFDGDGKSDLAVFRRSTGAWYINRSSNNSTLVTIFGVGTDIPAPADYTGDGKTDLAVFRPGNGSWYIARSEDGSFFSVPFGTLGDLPVPADYDGDGQADLGVFRPDGANWFLQRSTAGVLIQQFGMAGDEPLPLFFVRLALATPTITTHPSAQTVMHGLAVNFTAAATGSTPTYQWQRRATGASSWTDLANSGAYSGVTTATLGVTGGLAMNGDQFRVVINGLTGTSAISAAAGLTVTPAPRLLNLSTRGFAQTGTNVLIPGFVVEGSANKRLLIRAVGPTLGKPPFNLTGVLPNPRMELKRWNGTGYDTVMSNDEWSTNANAADITSTAANLFAFAFNDSHEAALLLDVAPGQYTIVADDAANASGIAIVELYDADVATVDSRLINISNRGFAGSGDQVMIPGFVVSAEGPRTLLLRVVGPTLAAAPFNVTGTMADPKLELHRTEANGSDTLVLTQDNWSEDPNAATTAQVAEQVFAFALNSGSKDAAVVATVPPGVYTVVGSSAIANGTGVVLVEVYVAP